jgi:hypothetical protein
MRKTQAWSLVALISTLCLLNAIVPPLAFQRAGDALQVTPVDLGALSPGETRAFKVVLRNTGPRSISLLPPRSDCGCVYHKANIPLTVPRAGSLVLPFSFRATPWPGDLRKKITLVAESRAGRSWEVPVTARVVAKAWAVPPSVRLSCDQASVAEASLVLYHNEQARIGSVLSDSPAIIVETEPRAGNRVQVSLTIRPPRMKAGETWERALRVLEPNGNSELLTIPVRIFCPPELQCVPNEIALDGHAGARLERNVALLARSDAGATLEAKPLFPWVHVASVEQRSRRFRVRLRFDTDSVPDNFRGNVVEFALRGKEASGFLVGVSKPP